MSTETIGVAFRSGGCVELVVDVQWLDISDDDFKFVRGPVDAIRSHAQVVDPPPPPAEVSIPISRPPKPKVVHREPPASKTPPPKHRDRSDRNTGRRPGPRSDKPDYPVIAAEVIRMRAAGESVATGLAAKFNVPLSTSKNWMHRCIELGLLPKEDARLRVVEDNTVTDAIGVAYDGPAVAASYLEATRAGVRPVQNVADHFGVDRTVAADWIRSARDVGLLPPANEPQLPDGERREILNAYKPEALA